MKIRKMGECNNCGFCCQMEGIQRNVVTEPDSDTQKFYELRGGKLQPGGAKLHYVMYAYVPCSAHNVVDKKCTIYENRPNICKAFPEIPDQIEGTPCSHWFDIENDDGTITQRGGQGSPFPTQPRFKS